ncbi:hypothetical protein EBT31_02160 [bacterium]|nr:hypothetical protein [bacterium]
MARKKGLEKAAAGLLGAAALLQATKTDLTDRGPKFQYEIDESLNQYRPATDDELRDARIKALKGTGIVTTSDGLPIDTLDGRGYLKSTPFKKGGSVSASKRADGMAQRGKTRGKMV